MIKNDLQKSNEIKNLMDSKSPYVKKKSIQSPNNGIEYKNKGISYYNDIKIQNTLDESMKNNIKKPSKLLTLYNNSENITELGKDTTSESKRMLLKTEIEFSLKYSYYFKTKIIEEEFYYYLIENHKFSFFLGFGGLLAYIIYICVPLISVLIKETNYYNLFSSKAKEIEGSCLSSFFITENQDILLNNKNVSNDLLNYLKSGKSLYSLHNNINDKVVNETIKLDLIKIEIAFFLIFYYQSKQHYS